MRLSAEQVKDAILHTDSEVREAAAFYFAQSHSSNPTVMPRVIEAIERFGFDAFKILPAADLVQTDETLNWLIRQIEIESPGTEQEIQYQKTLMRALREADAVVLKHHQEAILAMENFDGESKATVAERVSIAALAPDVLWRELIDFCDAEHDLDELTDQDYDRINAVVDAIGRYPELFAERVLASLIDQHGINDCLKGFLIRLTGKFHIEAAIPRLVDCFNYDDDWAREEVHEALPKIGTDAIVEEIAKRYLESDWSFRIAAASALEHIHSDLSVRTCLELCAQEQDVDLQGDLLQSALMNFSSDAIEPARQYLLRTPKSPEMLEVRSDLLVACKMLGETFPEFDAWLEDAKADIEFRRQWYKDHPLRQLAELYEQDEEDDSGQDFDDEPKQSLTIVRRQPTVGRNDPCPCGSGKKFKKCCYGKAGFEESDEVHSALMGEVQQSHSPAKFPIGTVAFYGPDDQTTTKIVAGVIKYDGADPILERWVGSSIKDNPKVKRQMQAFFGRYKVTNIVATDTNMGCPHEEGLDFPLGEDCAFCPFWAGKQGSNRLD